jgi:hypothetical protein
MFKEYWPGIILILIGAILLLHQMDLISFSKADIFTYGFILLGIMLIIKGSGDSQRRGVLGGTFFLSLGILWTLMRNNILVQDDHFGFAALFFALALANIIYYMVATHKGSNLIWGLVFIIVGGLILLRYLEYYYYWDIYDEIIIYWPLALILLGILLILKGYKKPAKV